MNNLIVAEEYDISIQVAMRLFHFLCLPFLMSDIIECKSKPNNIMKRFVLTAMGLGFLYIVAVSCNMSQNNQQNVQTNDLDTAVSYEMPADNVTEPYDPDKFALEAGSLSRFL